MKEFSLNSADKYKDGTPMMKMPETDIKSSYPDKATKNAAYGKIAERPNKFGIDFCEADCCPHWEKYCEHTLQDKHMCPYLPHDTDSNLKYLEQAFKEFAKTQDDLIEEYDAVLKTHGNTLEEHMEQIKINEGNIESLCCDMEDLQRKVLAIYKYFNAISPNVFFDICKGIEELAHKGADFCGNCTHCDHGKQGNDTVYVCELSAKIVDPDDSSCSMFEPPF